MIGRPSGRSSGRSSGRAIDAPPGSLELALARVLQLGTYASVAFVAAGSLVLVANGTSPVAGAPPLDLRALPSDVLALRPAGFLWIGILGVLATPAVRVLRALLGFWRRGERSMALVAALVILVITVGVLIGVMAG